MEVKRKYIRKYKAIDKLPQSLNILKYLSVILDLSPALSHATTSLHKCSEGASFLSKSNTSAQSEDMRSTFSIE